MGLYRPQVQSKSVIYYRAENNKRLIGEEGKPHRHTNPKGSRQKSKTTKKSPQHGGEGQQTQGIWEQKANTT